MPPPKSALLDPERACLSALSIASHEVRTPLAAIISIAAQLDGTGDYRAAALASEAAELLELVDSALDLSVLELGELRTAREALNVGQLLHDTAATHGVVPTLITACAVRAFADGRRLAQALGCLLRAARELGAGADPSLSVQQLADSARLHLELQVTHRASSSAAHQARVLLTGSAQAPLPELQDGGLGLSLAGRLLRLMGAGVRAAPAAAHSGNRYVVRLALPLAEPEPARPARTSSTEQARPLEPNGGRALRLLIADDFGPQRRALRRALERAGHQVSAAACGHEALAQLHAGRFDAVLLDVQMPGLDGFATARRLREAGCEAPVLLLTADTHDATRERCRLTGYPLIVKPASVATILGALQALGVG